MSLTSYQQAVLQEMAIPIWITKDAYTELKHEGQAKQSQAKQSDSHAVQRTFGNASSSSTHIPYSPNAQTNKSPSTPISQQEKQSRLAQLRANVGSSAKDKTKPQDGGAATPSTPATLQNEGKAARKGPVSPKGIPLSAEQKVKSQQWLKDLQLACIQLGIPSQWASTIMMGHTLSVTESAIILPATPLKLTTSQKRELWAQLISAARELNHSANGQ